ncbi:MAG TPA: RNA polymerase sigma-70 factor [Rikenellaceae bacterium]|nr:RNA polymerase sigma-70 factor [Rikenellaceae bacterium]
MKDISEKEILKGLKSGDEDAYRHIFQAWYGPLCTYAVGLVRDRFQAENIVDDAIFHLWEIRETVEIQTSLKGYLFSSVRNRSLNYLASAVRKKYKDIPDDEYQLVMDSLTAISKDDIYGKLFEDELKKCLMKELGGLSPECRKVFEKSRFDGLTYKEIANELGISVNTVKYHIKNALSVLRNGLGKYFLAILMIILSK